LKRSKYGDTCDATSTDILVRQLMKEAYNPVVLYKPYQGDIVLGDHSSLSQHADYWNMFCVGLQTKEQANMLEAHGGKILCGDATHGMTAYGFQVFSLVVKDDTGKGYTVASLVTSNVDKLVLSSFFTAVRSRKPNMVISVTMSDDDAATKEAFRTSFGPELTTLLCHWHVPLAWVRNLSKVSKSELKEELMYLLKRALRTRKRDEYDRICEVILTEYSDCKDFVDYICQYYLNRPEEWAMCYRLFFHDGVDTNMLLESLHNIMKTFKLERRPNRRVDNLLVLLLDMEEERYKEYTLEKAKNYVRPATVPSKKHEEGLKIGDSHVLKIAAGSWKFISATNIRIHYNITKKADFCKESHCYITCPSLACEGLCAHLYHCDCPDKDEPLCKHIHKLHAMEKRSIINKVFIVFFF